MLHPRILLGLGLVAIVAGFAAAFLTPLGGEALVVGIPIGAAIMIASVVGGGPKPVPPEGYTFPEAMGMLRRVTQATALVAFAIVGAAAGLWGVGTASATELLIIIALALLTVYAAMVTALGIIVVAHITGEGDEGLLPAG